MKKEEAERIAENIFSKTNDSYMIWNKNAQYGINHNTKLDMIKEISTAIVSAVESERERIARYLESRRDLGKELFMLELAHAIRQEER